MAKYIFGNTTALPMPNQAPVVGSATSGNYNGKTSSFNVNMQGDLRIDYTIDPKDTLMGKYTMGDAYDKTTQAVLPVYFPLGAEYPFKMAMVNWVHTFSPSLVNEARGGFSRVVWHQALPRTHRACLERMANKWWEFRSRTSRSWDSASWPSAIVPSATIGVAMAPAPTRTTFLPTTTSILETI